MSMTDSDDIRAAVSGVGPAGIAGTVDDRGTPGAPIRSRGNAVHGDARHLVAPRIIVASTVLAALFIRSISAVRLSPHVDEAASILAASVVADQGLPVLPSGTPYFQGFTLSLLLAPLHWMGFGSLDDLLLMRMVSVVAGTAAVWLAWRFGAYVTGSAWTGVIMAVLVAIDPLSVQWSGHVRMYALLQALTLALAWVFLRVLTGRRGRGDLLLLMLLSWAAVFTHIGASILVATIAVIAVVVYRDSLLHQRRLLATLAVSCAAPVALLALNSVLGTVSATRLTMTPYRLCRLSAMPRSRCSTGFSMHPSTISGRQRPHPARSSGSSRSWSSRFRRCSERAYSCTGGDLRCAGRREPDSSWSW